MSENLGMRRGIVIDNKDPEYRGRCKIFVPGVYPNEFAKTPENLPWAEPAMGLFGGGWTSAKNSKYPETGMCSVPHAGLNGDGAQVWVFFDADDIRYPVYFAVAQCGPGWFSKHNNQHVIITDNVKITVDEYDNFEPVKNPAEDNVSDNVASKVTSRPPQDLQNDISDIGGVSAVEDLYGRMGGASSAFDFIDGVGGAQGLQAISQTCSNGLSSFSSFIDGSGGVIGIRNLFNGTKSDGETPVSISVQDIREALNGSNTDGATKAIEHIEAQYGSMQNFQDQISQIGGIDGLDSIIDKFGDVDTFISSVEGLGDDGLAAMAEMESKLGGDQSFKEWNEGFTDDANSVNDMIDGKTAEDRMKEQQSGKKEKENEIITKSDTYVSGSGHPGIESAFREGVKTRLKIEVIAPSTQDNANNDIAIDLHVVGDVNMKLDGNLYKEINGKVYETYNDDHYVYHKKGYSEVQTGKRYEQIDDQSIFVFGGVVKQTFKAGLEKIINSKFITTMADAIYQLVSPLIEFKALNKMSIQPGNMEIDCMGNLNISAIKHITMTSKSKDVNIMGQHSMLYGSVGAKVMSDSVEIKGNGSVKIASDRSIRIESVNESKTASISVRSNTLSHTAMKYIFNSSLLSVFNMKTEVMKNTTGVVTEIVTGAETRTVTGAFTETIGGAETKTIGGVSTETITGIKTTIAPSNVLKSPAVTMAGLVYTNANSPAATADTPGGAPTVTVPVVTPAPTS